MWARHFFDADVVWSVKNICSHVLHCGTSSLGNRQLQFLRPQVGATIRGFDRLDRHLREIDRRKNVLNAQFFQGVTPCSVCDGPSGTAPARSASASTKE